MRKTLVAALGFVLVCFVANAQVSYYYRGEKVLLTMDQNYLDIVMDDLIGLSSAKNLLLNQNFEVEENDSQWQTNRRITVKFNNIPNGYSSYLDVINTLRKNSNVKLVTPYFQRGNDITPISVSDIFYIKLKEIKDTTLLKEIAVQQDVRIVKQVPYMPCWYILSLGDSHRTNLLEIPNLFYETGFFEDVDPAFMFNFRANCANDPLFSQLWGLKNTFYSGIDVNACNAWSITRGAGIKVAVVDQPIDVNHNDLTANIFSIFDTQNGTSPYNPMSLSHGTHVCGTIAAIKDNNLQVVGVAPESKIMGVSHDLYLSSTISAELASGISWAWQNGADVITNSWGDQGGNFYNQLQSSVLDDAIVNAMAQGRGGKGSVVMFAAGNYSPVMDYPANSNDDILTVGSINSNGVRSSFSGYGTKLDSRSLKYTFQRGW